jgi:hypothetical protein
MCKVYGWGLTKSKGSYEFKVQQIKVANEWGCTPWSGDNPAQFKHKYQPLIKSLQQKKSICAGSTGFTFCQVCMKLCNI